jgi:hypothetical protein
MADFFKQDHDMETIGEADGEEYYENWVPNFCVRPKSDDAEDYSSAVVPYQVERSHSQERIGALEDERNAIKAAYDLLFEFTQFVLHENVRNHPNITIIANLFNSFRTPHPDSIMGWKSSTKKLTSEACWLRSL